MTELVNTGIPVLQTVPHTINLLHIQHLRLNPVDLRYTRNLINRPTQQTQRQRLHNQVFNLVRLHLRLRGNGAESERAVVGRTTEDHLCQRGEGDLLVEEDLVRLEQLVLADVAGEHVVGGQIAAVECEKQLAQPVVRCLGQGIKDRVEEKLAEVVDGVGDQRGDTEVVGTLGALVFLEVLEVDAGQVQEGVFVERGEFLLGLDDVSFLLGVQLARPWSWI